MCPVTRSAQLPDKSWNTRWGECLRFNLQGSLLSLLHLNTHLLRRSPCNPCQTISLFWEQQRMKSSTPQLNANRVDFYRSGETSSFFSIATLSTSRVARHRRCHRFTALVHNKHLKAPKKSSHIAFKCRDILFWVILIKKLFKSKIFFKVVPAMQTSQIH